MPPEDDRGLATERTHLAWERTGLSLLAAAGLLTIAVVRHPDGWLVLPAVAVLVGAAVAAWRRARRAGTPPGDLRWVTGASVLAAVAAVVVLVVGFR